MTRSEYERLKAEAKARYDADLSAIERVWNLSSGNRAPAPKTPPVTPVSAPSTADKPQEPTQELSDTRTIVSGGTQPAIPDQPKRKRGSVHEIVRQVVDKHVNGAVFSSTLVCARVPDINRSSVSGALNRLAELGVLKVVEEGIGRRPTSYQKVS